jgi:hypothetical protein
MINSINQQTQFSARPPMSGYLYQCRYALYEALVKIKNDINFSVSIESIDDVVFENGDDSIDLIQTKHHIDKKGNLTDSSIDLWKSIRIWIDFIKKNEFKDNVNFYLITTANSSSNSIAYNLQPGINRNVQAAILSLNSVAITSSNTDNFTSYQLFNSLTNEEKESIFNKIFIFDSSPNIDNLDKNIKNELFYTVEQKHIESFITRFEGWWIRRIIRIISNTSPAPILGEEILSEIDHIRQQYNDDNLPIDDDILSSIVNESDHRDHIFSRQLTLLEISKRRIFFAMRDYYRAFTQRSRWLRDELLFVGDLTRYEQTLIEEWEIHFEEMKEHLSENSTEEEKKNLARELYKWIEKGELPKIRPRVTEPWISRGSYQMLANELNVGWHVEFKERIDDILGVF